MQRIPYHQILHGALVFFSCCCAVSCQKQDSIRSYRVPKESTVAAEAEAWAAAPSGEQALGERAAPEETKSPDRMLAALVTRGETVWSFKFLGPSGLVTRHADAFVACIRSLRFSEEGELSWTLPPGWKQLPASGMRLATLVPEEVNVAQGVSVLALPPQNTLDNVNRWRQQLGLSSIGEEELQSCVQRLDVEGAEVVLVDLEGKISASAMMPPLMGARNPAMPEPHPPRESKTSDDPRKVETPEIMFEVPSNWKAEEPGPMRLYLYSCQEGDRRFEFSVATLPPQGAAMLPNVNRWRGQLGLDPIDESALAGGIQERTIGEEPGKIVELTQESESTAQKSIVAAMVVRADRAWFFKLQGDASLIREQRKDFDNLLDSIRFP